MVKAARFFSFFSFFAFLSLGTKPYGNNSEIILKYILDYRRILQERDHQKFWEDGGIGGEMSSWYMIFFWGSGERRETSNTIMEIFWEIFWELFWNTHPSRNQA